MIRARADAASICCSSCFGSGKPLCRPGWFLVAPFDANPYVVAPSGELWTTPIGADNLELDMVRTYCEWQDTACSSSLHPTTSLLLAFKPGSVRWSQRRRSREPPWLKVGWSGQWPGKGMTETKKHQSHTQAKLAWRAMLPSSWCSRSTSGGGGTWDISVAMWVGSLYLKKSGKWSLWLQLLPNFCVLQLESAVLTCNCCLRYLNRNGLKVMVSAKPMLANNTTKD